MSLYKADWRRQGLWYIVYTDNFFLIDPHE